ncbi:MAG TPA: response regulator [bacterium]|nr:response regulator [bacterium]HNS33949.1 response regulator [bacterium]HNW09353.1 response regulator [bacterium]HNZ73478.1 response regulator [bacterium]HOH67486.1 response regulator [bacterium]
MGIEGKKILIVEDEPELASIYSMMMDHAGLKVDVARDGAEAIEKIRRINPDLVLLDLLMPEVDGYQTLKEIKQDPKYKQVSIYVWSNLTQKNEVALAKRLGADGYLVKSDYTPSKLLAKVIELLNAK